MIRQPTPRQLWFSLLLVFCTTASALADSVTVRGYENKNVRIIGLRQGRLYFRTSGGNERNALLQDVSAIQLEKYPKLAEADKAFDEGKFDVAAKTLAPIFDKAEEDFVQVLTGAKLVVALDRSGQYEAAAIRYADLLTKDNSPLTQSARPSTFPKEEADRAAVTKKLEELAATTGDPIVKKYLTETIEQLKSGQAPMPTGDLEAQSGLLRTAKEAQQDPIDVALKDGKHAQVMDLTGKMLAAGEGVPPRLLYQRGQALTALERDRDAMLSYMRVAVHFPNSSYTRQSLVEAGRLYLKLDKTAQARKLWTEARSKALPDSEEAREIDALLAQLPE